LEDQAPDEKQVILFVDAENAPGVELLEGLVSRHFSSCARPDRNTGLADANRKFASAGHSLRGSDRAKLRELSRVVSRANELLARRFDCGLVVERCPGLAIRRQTIKFDPVGLSAVAIVRRSYQRCSAVEDVVGTGELKLPEDFKSIRTAALSRCRDPSRSAVTWCIRAAHLASSRIGSKQAGLAALPASSDWFR